MLARTTRIVAALALTAVAACHPDNGPTPPNGQLSVGQALNVNGATSFNLEPGATAGEYVAVLVNNGLVAGQTESYTLRGDGLGTPSGYLASSDQARFSAAAVQGASEAPVVDHTFEARLRARERTELTPRFAAARAWFAERSAASTTLGGIPLSRSNSVIPSTVAVGDTVTVNVNGTDACSNAIYHKARVAAIGTHALILNDVNNPSGGFTDADFARFAARFDTLVWPLDVTAFGTPTDIDNNGHIGLIFTVAVNQLTPRNSSTYIAGFHFSRDLFPTTTQGRLQGCAGSNVGEFFYLLAPDPLGTINGNRRTTGFVDSNTTAVIAHEFQHLINNSRRLYVNNANVLEARWLDEGLAHIAEELLFYREAGLTSRRNLGATEIRASATVVNAFNLDMVGNSGRYRSYLLRPSTASPYADDDSLQTRGGAWDLLRYLADQTGASDGDTFFRIVNSTDSGTVNLNAVFGGALSTRVRDWAVSHASDDVVSTDESLQQPSWNWHSNYTALYGAYPLPIATLTNASAVSGSVTAGGAAYYRLAVPANTAAPLSLSQSSPGGNLQLVIVRTK